MADQARTVNHIGIVGAGTMGSGIAQTAALAGLRTTLVEPDPAAIERAQRSIETALEKGVERGRWSADDADLARGLLRWEQALDALGASDLVVEATPERLDLKREIFADLERVCGETTVLATNTSSLLVAAIARDTQLPQRVIGMHFFNPVALMRLVEVVPGIETSPATVETTGALVKRLGKRPIVATDGIGFLVNRCGRPFVGEALRLLQERIATVEQIDRICRMGGGFRMGPFELADLIGLDVNLEIAESFWHQSYGEPRWKPNPIQAKLVAAGHLGRKSGRGFHEYGPNAPRPTDPEPPPIGGGDGQAVTIVGRGALAEDLRDRARQAGWAVLAQHEKHDQEIRLLVDADPQRRAQSAGGNLGPIRAVLCAGTSLSALGDPRACGFHLTGPIESARLVETTGVTATRADATGITESFFRTLGLHVERVEDAPGLVLGRILSQLVNEAAFALGEGVGTADDIDLGTTLGLGYPRGSVAWGDAIGLPQVRATLAALHSTRGEERYRPAPLLTSSPDTLRR
jgi:3-hydroxybutyryl-CoA dehydrogenase